MCQPFLFFFIGSYSIYLRTYRSSHPHCTHSCSTLGVYYTSAILFIIIVIFVLYLTLFYYFLFSKELCNWPLRLDLIYRQCVLTWQLRLPTNTQLYDSKKHHFSLDHPFEPRKPLLNYILQRILEIINSLSVLSIS